MIRPVIGPLLAALLAFAFPGAAPAQQEVFPCAQGISGQGAKSAGCLIQPQATASAIEGSHVFKATGPVTLVDFQVNNTSGSTVWVMVFDAAAAPTGAGAAVTGCTTAAAARPCVAKWYQLVTNATINVSWAPGPFPQLQTGLVIACSSTGPFTLTYSANCTFSAEAM
jgi:hypothetical protein